VGRNLIYPSILQNRREDRWGWSRELIYIYIYMHKRQVCPPPPEKIKKG
jgi:hypothetical protein